MKKYIEVAKNTWEEIMVYRLNFVMWRVRTILQLLTVYFLWLTLLPSDKTLFGYSQSLMLTYVLGTSIIGSIVLSSKSISVGDEINKGNLSNFLVRPINYFFYWFSKDLADKTINSLFSIFEIIILFFILKPQLFIQTNSSYLFLSFLSILMAVVLFFFFNFLIGLIGFWSPEVWGPRFIFIIVLSFFAGGLFPLDILPKPLFEIFNFFPFAYLIYFPLKIYLGKLSFETIFLGFLICSFWIMLLQMLVKILWKKGLIIYSSEGK